MPTTIDAIAWMWNPKVTVPVLFQQLRYLTSEFRFVTDQPKFYFFSRKEQAKKIPRGAVRIYMPIENHPPDMAICDWAFTFWYDEELKNKYHFRLPNYTRVGAGEDLVKKNYSAEAILKSKTKFCAFLYSHSVPFRDAFFKKLSQYKKVDSPGRVCNNMPFLGGYKTNAALKEHLSFDFYSKYEEKIKFLRDYKFVIAFENESAVGYTSEKIYHAMKADSVALYWGNPLVHRDFNPKSFVNFHEFKSIDAMIDRVVQIDKDEDLYLQYLKQPWYPENTPTRYTDKATILRHFKKVFGDK